MYTRADVAKHKCFLQTSTLATCAAYFSCIRNAFEYGDSIGTTDTGSRVLRGLRFDSADVYVDMSGACGLSGIGVAVSLFTLLCSIDLAASLQRHDFKHALHGGPVARSERQYASNQMQHNPLEGYQVKNVASYDARPRNESPAVLTVNDTSLRHNGQWVEVCWRHLPFPSTGQLV